LAAVVITVLCLTIVIGPVTWLGLGLIRGAEFLAGEFDSKPFAIPLPSESVKGWPIIGEQAYELWARAATDTKAILLEIAPSLKPLGGKFLEIAGSVVFGLLEFVASILIAGFLYVPGPQLLDALRGLLRRILGQRSEEMVTLAGTTIRNISRGVVGVALVQAFLAGLGFLAAGIPAAGFLGFLALLLGIVQIGPAILILPTIIWCWTAREISTALTFTAYMVPVSLIDNILRPIVMARGLTTPMPIILVGVIGGTIADGMSGLFLGPIVLSVAWALSTAWLKDSEPAESI
jgi:predicted PurR-regulated permease PerM